LIKLNVKAFAICYIFKSDIGGVENPTVPPSSDGSSDNNIIPNNKNIDILSNLELEPMALETFKIDF
jgi:hypothetical protein